MPAHVPTPALSSGRIKYLAFGQVPDTFSMVWYRDMEQALGRLGLPAVVHPRNRWWMLVAKVAARCRLVRAVARVRPKVYIVPVMHVEEYRYFPVTYWAEVIPLCFDCWPNRWDEWERVFRRQRTRTAFFTARAAAEEFSRRCPQLRCHWLPEGTLPERWHPHRPLAQRSIDVLELGRQHRDWHNRVTAGLKQAKKVHRYEEAPGKHVFPSLTALVEGYGDAKLSICFPQSLTHPERAGSIETVTMRYFESMASRCLILGHCPSELQDDFGYNPVVTADLRDPLTQVMKLLEHPESHVELIERNYHMVLSKANWSSRFRQLLEVVVSERPALGLTPSSSTPRES
jgi:hypothetical protein